jgi:subtilisin-like proprotein convertase family protein
LHNRAGGSADDLVRGYDITTTPALAAFAGESSKGDWTLHVQDLARADRGRLMAWSIDLSGRAGAEVEGEDVAGLTIPDNAPGIQRIIALAGSGTVKSVEVEMDISHTFIGDLSLMLSAPDGTAILLHNRAGGSMDNIIRTYTTDNTTALGTFRGTPIAGDWKLAVRDHAAADRGKLNRWALRMERE